MPTLYCQKCGSPSQYKLSLKPKLCGFCGTTFPGEKPIKAKKKIVKKKKAPVVEETCEEIEELRPRKKFELSHDNVSVQVSKASRVELSSLVDSREPNIKDVTVSKDLAAKQLDRWKQQASSIKEDTPEQ